MSIFSLFDDPWSDPYQSQSYRQRALQAQRERQQQQELERRRRAKLAEQERQRRMQQYYQALEEARQQELLEQKRREQLQRRQQELLRQRHQQQQAEQQAVSESGSLSDSDSDEAEEEMYAGDDPISALFGPMFQSRRNHPSNKAPKKGKKAKKAKKVKTGDVVNNSQSPTSKPQSAHIPVRGAQEQDSEPMALDPTPVPAAPTLSPEEAAILLQRVYRGYQVRQQDIINKLRALDAIGKCVDDIVSERDSQGHTMKNAIRFDEELTQQLLKVDGVMSGQSVLVRERRRALVRRIEKELKAIDNEKESLSHSDSESEHCTEDHHQSPTTTPSQPPQDNDVIGTVQTLESEQQADTNAPISMDSTTQGDEASTDGDYEMVAADPDANDDSHVQEHGGEQSGAQGEVGEEEMVTEVDGPWDADQVRAILQENQRLKRRVSELEQQLGQVRPLAKRRPSV